MKNKNKKITIRVSEKELEILKQKSQKAKMSMSKFILHSAFNKPIVIRNDKEFLRILAGIGNNLNQLTRLANAREVKVLDLMNLKQEVIQLCQLYNSLIQKQD